MLLGELKKKYTTSVDEKKKPEFLGNVAMTKTEDSLPSYNDITQGTNIDDTYKLNLLMSEYLNDEELKQFNQLINTDNTISKEVFKKELISNSINYIDNIQNYTQVNDFNINDFYQYVKNLIIGNTDLVLLSNYANATDLLGIENPNDVTNQYNKQKN